MPASGGGQVGRRRVGCRLRGKPAPHPGVEASVQDADPVVPALHEDPRQTGAGGLRRSGAVEDEIPVARQVVGVPVERGGPHPKGAGYHPLRSGEVVVPAQVQHHGGRLPPHPFVQFLRGDAGGRELPDQEETVGDPPRDRGGNAPREDPPHRPLDPLRRLGDLLAEGESQYGRRPRPEGRARQIQRGEDGERHVRHPGQRGGDRVHPREEFREEDGGDLPAVEPVHGTLQARVGVERHPAEAGKNPFPPPPPGEVPGRVGEERAQYRRRDDHPQERVTRGRPGAGEDEDREDRNRQPGVFEEGEEERRRHGVLREERPERSHASSPSLRGVPALPYFDRSVSGWPKRTQKKSSVALPNRSFPPAMFSPASFPCLIALRQPKLIRLFPLARFATNSAQSPAAYTSGALVRRKSSTRTPVSVITPLPFRNPIAGTRSVATTTIEQWISPPSRVRRTRAPASPS